jgi:heavy metal sensor kinase
MIDSVRARLTAWYVGILGITLIVFELAVYAVLSRTLHAGIDDSLTSAIEVTSTSLSNDIGEGQSRTEAARATVDELSSRQVAVAVFDVSGDLMASRDVDDDIQPRLPAEGDVPDESPRLYDVLADDDRVRVGIQRVHVAGDQRPFVVHVSTPLEPLEDELEDIRAVLLSSIPFVLFAAGGAGWFMARKSLSPVVIMADRARAISATNLDQRLPVSNPRDELGRLARTFNELLTRIGAAFTQQRQFMADASHELRTPLATIRAAADVTLQQPARSETEYRDALRMILDQTVRLSHIVEDMFTLARADAGHVPLRLTPLYLDELLTEIAAAASVRGARSAVRVVITGETDVECECDEELIRRLFGNLVDNALKYSPSGAVIDVRLERRDDRARILVTDRGGGIPLDAQQHVFERFFRADQARVRSAAADGAGAGLGLAIARWVAEAHGGTLELLRSDASGTTFAVELPCSPAHS